MFKILYPVLTPLSDLRLAWKKVWGYCGDTSILLANLLHLLLVKWNTFYLGKRNDLCIRLSF